MSVLDEWIRKAEADYKAAVALNRRRRDPLPDVVCSMAATRRMRRVLRNRLGL